MSSFNETVPMKSFQAQAGSAEATVAQLEAVKDQPAHKGVSIRNIGPGTLYVGSSNVSSVFGYELNAGEEIELELEDPTSIYVITTGASVPYTWLAY